jgi:hypothetical protein
MSNFPSLAPQQGQANRPSCCICASVTLPGTWGGVRWPVRDSSTRSVDMAGGETTSAWSVGVRRVAGEESIHGRGAFRKCMLHCRSSCPLQPLFPAMPYKGQACSTEIITIQTTGLCVVDIICWAKRSTYLLIYSIGLFSLTLCS